MRAWKWLGSEQLHEKAYEPIYPLAWQNEYLMRMMESLDGVALTSYVIGWLGSGWREVVEEFFGMCGSARGSKVLWLFIRDHLGLPAFPIDRHMKRALKEFGLPVDSWRMTDICERAGVDTNRLARALFSGRLVEP